MSELTGGLSTDRLRRISRNGSLTVTIARRIHPGEEEFFADWAERMASEVRAFPGCLGAAVLASPDGAESHMVFRFVDGEALRSWERSPERSALLAEIDGTVDEERVTTVAGEEEFFASLATVRQRRPFAVRVAIDVAWIFPVAFLWSAVLAPWFVGLPVAVGTMLSAGVITLLAELVLAPVRRRLRSRRGLPLDRVVRS